METLAFIIVGAFVALILITLIREMVLAVQKARWTVSMTISGEFDADVVVNKLRDKWWNDLGWVKSDTIKVIQAMGKISTRGRYIGRPSPYSLIVIKRIPYKQVMGVCWSIGNPVRCYLHLYKVDEVTVILGPKKSFCEKLERELHIHFRNWVTTEYWSNQKSYRVTIDDNVITVPKI